MDPSLPLFQPHVPVLLQPPSALDHGTKNLQTPHSVLGGIAGPPWNMIASTSSMWQDHKHSIAMTYSTPDNGTEGHQFNETTTWCGDTVKNSSTGISRSVPDEPGRVYDWRGTGWLRLITTRWEIVGLGGLPILVGHDHTKEIAQPSSGSDCEQVPVLVTFVRKTMFSPQALSVLVRPQLDDAQKAAIIEHVAGLLKGLGVTSLSAEVDRLRPIP
ncbi:hypothetical protein PG989_007688 [Apiospora arundinis]